MIQGENWEMKDKRTVVASILAALSGICFISGVTLLTNEGGAETHEPRKEFNVNN